MHHSHRRRTRLTAAGRAAGRQAARRRVITRLGVTVAALAVAAAWAPAGAQSEPSPAPDAPAAAVDSATLIAQLLVANGAPARRAGPVAAAVLRYTRLRALDPLLVVGIIGVENATLVRHAQSRAGARGVMQVMPHWTRDIRDCGGDDLRDVRVNVCFATRVLRIALDASTSVREALLRYNGCVRAPGCTRYASAVFSQAGRAVLLSRALPAASVARADQADAGGRAAPAGGM